MAAAALAASVGLSLTACGGPAESTQSSAATAKPPASAPPISLNHVSAGALVSAITDAGLPAPDPRDESSQQCTEDIACTEAIATGTVSVLKFASTGAAQRYAGQIPDMFQVEDVVLVFSSTVPPDRRTAYEDVVKRALH